MAQLVALKPGDPAARYALGKTLALTGFHLPDAGGHYFLALRMGLPSPAPVPSAPTSRDADSGLFDKESFTEVAKSRLQAIDDSSKDYKYSVFQLGGLSELRARLDEERRIQLLATIGETLRADSLYGDTAGQIDDDRFGLVHGASTKLGIIKSRIEKSSRDADPKKEGVQIRSASVDLDTEGMSDDDALNALTATAMQRAAAAASKVEDPDAVDGPTSIRMNRI